MKMLKILQQLGLLLLASAVAAVQSGSQSPQALLHEVACLYRLDLALAAATSPAVRKELAKSCLRARTFKVAAVELGSAEDRACLESLAAGCDLRCAAMPGGGGIELSCKHGSLDEAFSSRNWAIEMLLEDVIKSPAQQSSSTSSHASKPVQQLDERSLIISEFKASKKDTQLETKATRLWKLYTTRYRHTNHIRIRLYRMADAGGSPIKEFSVPVLSTPSDLNTPERCGLGKQIFKRGHNNGAVMEKIDLSDCQLTLLELGLHPSANLYFE